MDNNKLFNIMQVATGIALLVGLVLVFVELRQAKELTLAELSSQGYAEGLAEFRTIMGENSAAVIAKSCIAPESLTPEEMVILSAYYSGRVAQVSRLRVLEFVAEFGVPWQTLAVQQLSGILDTEPGRQWFNRNLQQDSELFAIGQKIIEGGEDCKNPLIPPGVESLLKSEMNN